MVKRASYEAHHAIQPPTTSCIFLRTRFSDTLCVLPRGERPTFTSKQQVKL
jgi:hypothetical protein